MRTARFNLQVCMVRMAVDVAKTGYEMDNMRGVFEPSGQSSPTNRVIFTMWKLRGAEPMTHTVMYSSVPIGDSGTNFDLLRGRRDPDGELLVKVTRQPTNIERLKPFDWSVTFEITNGGLIECTNIYPYEAPAEGYQQALTLNFQTNMAGWQRNFYKRQFYFKSQGGQVYGRMTIDIDASSLKGSASFHSEIAANPAGSRNLEFDGKKWISNLPPRELSDVTIRQLAAKYRDEWLAKQPEGNKRFVPIFARSSIVSIERKRDGWDQGWHVTFVTPGEEKPAAPEETNDYRLDYRLYVDLMPNGQFIRAGIGMANEYVVAGKDTIWGSSVLHVEKIDNSRSQIDGVRIVTNEPDGQVSTITANKGMLEPIPDLFSVKIKLFLAHIEKSTTTTNCPYYEIILNL